MNPLARGGLLALLAVCALVGAAPEPRMLLLRAEFSWAGLAPRWPRYSFSVQCQSDHTCQAAGSRWEIQGQKKFPGCNFNTATVSEKLLQDLWRASTLKLEPVKEPVSRIEHTDDYPRFSVMLRTSSETLLFLNTSNGRNPPWNIQRGSSWFVQYSGEFERSYEALVKSLPCIGV